MSGCVLEQMAAMEAGLTGFGELLPLKKYRYGRELFLALIFGCVFLIALTNTTAVRTSQSLCELLSSSVSSLCV